MTQNTPDLPTPSLAELTLRGRSKDTTATFTLRLTPGTLVLTPSDETAAMIQQHMAAGEASLEQAPRLIRLFATSMMKIGQIGMRTAFTPHPLADTDIKLEGERLHVRIGHFNSDYGIGEFDPAAAAAFIAQYQAARNQASQ